MWRVQEKGHIAPLNKLRIACCLYSFMIIASSSPSSYTILLLVHMCHKCNCCRLLIDATPFLIVSFLFRSMQIWCLYLISTHPDCLTKQVGQMFRMRKKVPQFDSNEKKHGFFSFQYWSVEFAHKTNKWKQKNVLLGFSSLFIACLSLFSIVHCIWDLFFFDSPLSK